MYALFLLCMRYYLFDILAVCLIPAALYALIISPCMRCGVCVKGGTRLRTSEKMIANFETIAVAITKVANIVFDKI